MAGRSWFRHYEEPEPYPRFVVGIDVPVCPNSCSNSPHYYSDEYFAELAGPAIMALMSEPEAEQQPDSSGLSAA